MRIVQGLLAKKKFLPNASQVLQYISTIYIYRKNIGPNTEPWGVVILMRSKAECNANYASARSLSKKGRYICKSTTNNCSLMPIKFCSTSALYIENNIGSNTEPWGVVIVTRSETEFNVNCASTSKSSAKLCSLMNV